jgi:hypothetical protein
MPMSWSTEYDLRRALRDGDEELVEEILRRDRFADFDEVKQVFEDERKGRIRPIGNIEYGDLEIRDKFGRPDVRKKE